jgi:hypothetical protein
MRTIEDLYDIMVARVRPTESGEPERTKEKK